MLGHLFKNGWNYIVSKKQIWIIIFPAVNKESEWAEVKQDS